MEMLKPVWACLPVLVCLTVQIGYGQSPARDTSATFPVTRLGEPGKADEWKPSPFAVSHLESTPLGTSSTLGIVPVAESVPKPAPLDSLALWRWVDSVANRRALATKNAQKQDAGSGKTSKGSEGLIDRLRDVPSIFPFYIPNESGLVKARMSSGFGMRQHPVMGNFASHAGIDLPAPVGTLVYATADGYCRQIVNQPQGIGLAIYLTHGRGYQSLYGHLLTTWIQPGDYVFRGQIIGRVGASGMTTGPHLHYGVRHKGQVVDPLPYCFLLANSVKPASALTRK